MGGVDFDVRRKWRPRNPVRWGDVEVKSGEGGAIQRTRELVRVESPLPTSWNLFGQLTYDPPSSPVQMFRLVVLCGIGAMNQTLIWRVPFFQDPSRTTYPIAPYGETLDLVPGASLVVAAVPQPIPAEWLAAYCEFSVDTGGAWGPVQVSLGAAPITALDPSFYPE
jgi:hypothetical protein